MFDFLLVALNGQKFNGQVHEVLLPTLEGEIGVFEGHMPLVSVADYGVISVRVRPTDRDDMMELFAITGGVIEVEDNTLRVLVDAAESADDINEDEAQKAFEAAQKLKVEATDQISLDKAQSLIDRQSVRLQVANLKRRRRS